MEIHLMFVDVYKAFDRINRNCVLEAITKQGVYGKVIRLLTKHVHIINLKKRSVPFLISSLFLVVFFNQKTLSYCNILCLQKVKTKISPS